MDKYLVLAFMLLLGSAAATDHFVSAYYYPDRTMHYHKSNVPMSVRGKIEIGGYFTYWTLLIIAALIWAPLYYAMVPGFFYMLWRCDRAYHEDKRAFEASKVEKPKSDAEVVC